MPRRPAVFFDRDNTLIVAGDYLGDPDRVVLAPGAAESLGQLRRAGFLLVTVSNQSGVARGYFGEDAVHAVDARMSALLAAGDADARIDLHLFCPHHPEITGPCDCRKPLPGMLFDAARRLDVDLEKSWLVGDAPRDVEAGRTAGCRTILLTLPGVVPSPAASEGDACADAAVDSLAAAVAVILACA